MKKKLLFLFLLSATMLNLPAQVTNLSNNTSYDWGFALNNTTIMLRSAISKTIFAYDIPGNTFTELSTTVLVEDDYDYGVMNGILYFAGRTAGDGIELWKSNGTPVGTVLVKNINAGVANSEPKYGFQVYNNEIYFTANDGTTGRELWKSDGTDPNTVRVKDINTGAPDAFTTSAISDFKVIGGVLVFTATTAADGDEPWKSDGSEPGTIQLKNINTFPAFGSGVTNFTEYGTNLIFRAADFLNDAIWKTDGTPGGTVLVKDIDPADNPLSIVPSFFNFQNELYFSGDNGTTGFELWKTNGTDPGTVLVKDIDPGDDGMGTPNNGLGFLGLALAVKNSSKFFFAATTVATGVELWQSDGTGPGTIILKDIVSGATGSDPFLLPKFYGNGLFQGNKFFFVANTPGVEGNEFYISDGTPGGTTLLKDIYPGPANGFDMINLGWFYTDNKFFFLGDDGITGSELWQSDGTGTGTTIVADVNTMPSSDGSDIQFTAVASNTLFFFGTDGDHLTNTDFFKLNAPVTLPLRWVSFEARPDNDDVLLTWKTAEEVQTDYFVVQRSADGTNYNDIGRVNANGGLTNNYTFTDAGAMLKTGIKKWFYRIKYVDKDGKSALSRVAAIALNKTIAQIRILPNPVSSELKLVIDAVKNSSAVIQILNTEGKTVLKKSVNLVRGENVITNDIGHLPAGVYLLQTVADGSTTVERFLIQR